MEKKICSKKGCGKEIKGYNKFNYPYVYTVQGHYYHSMCWLEENAPELIPLYKAGKI